MGGEVAAEAPPSPPGSDPTRRRVGRSLTLLRMGLGVVWSLNLVYVLDPANQFFSTFSSTAVGFGGTSLGGAAIPNFVAEHALVFALLIAGATAYLSVAFLLGLTLRWACLTGAVFNAVLLVTQFGGLATMPGGTDIGPQPLYLLVYIALFAGAGLDAFSVDRWLASERAARRGRMRGLSARSPAT